MEYKSQTNTMPLNLFVQLIVHCVDDHNNTVDVVDNSYNIEHQGPRWVHKVETTLSLFVLHYLYAQNNMRYSIPQQQEANQIPRLTLECISICFLAGFADSNSCWLIFPALIIVICIYQINKLFIIRNLFFLNSDLIISRYL